MDLQELKNLKLPPCSYSIYQQKLIEIAIQ